MRSPSVMTYLSAPPPGPPSWLATVSIGAGRRLIIYIGLKSAMRSGCNSRGAGIEHDVEVILLVGFMRNHGRALRKIRPQAAGVIEMMVRIHDVFDQLVGDQPICFLDDGQRPGFVLGRLHDSDEVLELHQHAVVSASAEQPDAIGELLALDS